MVVLFQSIDYGDDYTWCVTKYEFKGAFVSIDDMETAILTEEKILDNLFYVEYSTGSIIDIEMAHKVYL